jgi:hypothetical protein
MDLRVGQGPFVCVNCFLPGATTGTNMSPGDCVLAGGSWNPDANGGATTASSGSSSNVSAPLPPDLNTSTGTPFDTCKSLTIGGQVLSGILGGDVQALQNAQSQLGTCVDLANAPHPGINSNDWMACLNAALFPQFTQPNGQAATYKALSPDDAKAACQNVVPAVSGSSTNASTSPAPDVSALAQSLSTCGASTLPLALLDIRQASQAQSSSSCGSLSNQPIDATQLATAACVSSAGKDATQGTLGTCGLNFGAGLAGSVKPENQLQFVSCIKGAVAAGVAVPGATVDKVNAAIAQICGPLVTPVSTGGP